MVHVSVVLLKVTCPCSRFKCARVCCAVCYILCCVVLCCVLYCVSVCCSKRHLSEAQAVEDRLRQLDGLPRPVLVGAPLGGAGRRPRGVEVLLEIGAAHADGERCVDGLVLAEEACVCAVSKLLASLRAHTEVCSVHIARTWKRSVLVCVCMCTEQVRCVPKVGAGVYSLKLGTT